MDGYKISEAARAAGFTVSALRFYEREGVVVPERTAAGYRNYRENDVESLRFVARGKQLGLSLDEITELLGLIDEEECGPVQTRIRQLVHERIGQAHDQIAQLSAFTAQLQMAAARLGIHTPDGACDDDCGCRSDPERPAMVNGVGRLPFGGPEEGDISCSLSPGSVAARIEDWKRILASATTRVSVPGGVRVIFDRGADVSALAALAAAEQTCCSFFHFDIGIGSDGVTHEVTGPDDAQEVITGLFGVVA